MDSARLGVCRHLLAPRVPGLCILCQSFRLYNTTYGSIGAVVVLRTCAQAIITIALSIGWRHTTRACPRYSGSSLRKHTACCASGSSPRHGHLAPADHPRMRKGMVGAPGHERRAPAGEARGALDAGGVEGAAKVRSGRMAVSRRASRAAAAAMSAISKPSAASSSTTVRYRSKSPSVCVLRN